MQKLIEESGKRGIKVYSWCYSDDTEVFTNNGWKLFRDVLDTDLIMSRNPDTHNIEFVPFTQKIEYSYQGDMIHFSSTRDDVLVTPNHRMYISSKGQSWHLEEAQQVVKRSAYKFCKFANWEGIDKDFNLNGKTYPAKWFAEFMGWFLSEGCVSKKQNSIRISQYQSVNPEKYEAIKQMLGEQFLRVGEYKSHGEDYFSEMVVNDKAFHDYLAQFGGQLVRYIPDEIKNMSAETISIFLNAYRLGDGFTDKITGRVTYCTSSKRMAEDLTELILKTGKHVSYFIRGDHWWVREVPSKTSTHARTIKGGIKHRVIPYDGMVYCVELEKNHVLLTKRENKLSWQGNCIMECVEPLPEDPKKRQEMLDIFGDGLPPGAENCSGFFKWTDLIDKFRSLDRYVWDTQWLCRRPDTQGLVYSRFDEVLNFAKDFKINREALNNGWGQIYLFEDFGTSANHPGVILFAYYDKLKQEIILFDELFSVGKPSDVIIDDMLAKLSEHGLTRADIAGWICDPHNNAEQMHRANKGYPMMGNYFVTDPSQKLPGDMYIVKNGISHVRKFIDDRRVKITDKLVEFRREIMSYAYKKNMRGEYTEEAAKENDHSMDSLRYGLIWLFPLEAAGSFGADDYESYEESSSISTLTGGIWDSRF